jgi:hypothetical protein
MHWQHSRYLLWYGLSPPVYRDRNVDTGQSHQDIASAQAIVTVRDLASVFCQTGEDTRVTNVQAVPRGDGHGIGRRAVIALAEETLNVPAQSCRP